MIALRPLVLAATLVLATSCTWYSTATHWNMRMGPSGRPVFYRSASRLGFNILVFLPFIARTDIDRMIDLMTESVANEGGNVVRVVQAGSDNYWYGFSPLTWLITPVVSSIDIEYEPSAEELERVRREQAEEAGRPRVQAEPFDDRPIVPPDRMQPAQRKEDR